jgi:hypothetical protein
MREVAGMAGAKFLKAEKSANLKNPAISIREWWRNSCTGAICAFG